jgi:hypothetical protein
MATIPTPLLGRHVSSVTVRWQTPDANGLLGNGTSTTQTITGIIDGVEIQGTNQTETINNLTSTRENEVVIESADSIVLTEIMRDGINAANVNVLAAIWTNADSADYCLVTIARGGNSFTFYGLMSDYSESIRKGKNTARMTFQMIDIDASMANPVYA